MSTTFAFLQNMGPWEIGLIVLLVLLLFGGRKLPELARGAGKAIREFRSASSEAEKTFKDAMSDPSEKEPQKTEPNKPVTSTAEKSSAQN